VHVATPIALYLLNHKRERLQEIEHRYGMRVIVAADDTQTGSGYRIDRTRSRAEGEFIPAPPPAGLPPLSASAHLEADDEEPMAAEDASEEAAPPAPASGRTETAEEAADRGKRRRRRRRRGRREDGSPLQPGETEGEDTDSDSDDTDAEDAIAAEPGDESETAPAEGAALETPADTAGDGEEDGKGRRRGRRGGRRKRRDGTEGDLPPVAEPDAEQPALPPLPAYAGPTPANPFGGEVFDLFDVLEQAEQRAAASTHAYEPDPQPEPFVEPLLDEVPQMVTEPVIDAVAEVLAPAVDVPPAIALAPEPEPATEPVVVAELVPVPEPVLEPVVGPAIQPVVVGEAPPAEKKRGWWRR